MIDFMTAKEPVLKSFLLDQLDADFFIRREVTGKHLINGERVKADFVLQPKSHLLDLGFDDCIFVVEVKAVYSSNQSPWSRMMHVCHQTVTYMQSRFDFGRPLFALVFPDFRYFADADFVRIQNPIERRSVADAVLRTVQNMGMFEHVGCLDFDTDYYTKQLVWKISMGGQRLFSIPDGRNPANLLRERVGNFEG